MPAPARGQLHALKEDFRALFETEADREGAKARLQRWMTPVETRGLSKLTKFVGTLRRRFEHILNDFPHRLTRGMVEGLNNKVKVIKRCAYGFRNFAHFALRIQIESRCAFRSSATAQHKPHYLAKSQNFSLVNPVD